MIRRVAALSGLFVLITFSMLFFSNNIAKSREPVPGRAYVIVLGCGLNGESVSTILRLRLDKALEYYRNNQDSVIIVSGGQGADEPISEALAMKNYLIGRGVPEGAVIMEDMSVNTKENLRFSKEVLDSQAEGEPVLVVTSDFHMFRAMSYAAMAGLEAASLSSPIHVPFHPLLYAREYAAVMWYYVFESWR